MWGLGVLGGGGGGLRGGGVGCIKILSRATMLEGLEEMSQGGHFS